MELSSASLEAIKAEIKATQSKLLSLMMDYAKFENYGRYNQRILLMALADIQEWEDSTCSMADLLAPEEPVKNCNERVLENRKIVDNWYRYNAEDVDS